MPAKFEQQPIYTKLGWEWSWRGIGVRTLLMGMAPGLMSLPWALLAGQAPLGLTLVVCGTTFFCLLQYRREENLLLALLRRRRKPRHLRAQAPENDQPPFPVPRASLQ